MRKQIALLLILVSWLASPAIRAAELEQAAELISEGDFASAYKLLEPLELQMSGNEDFDLLFGFSALETGHASIATLSFERVLAVNPENSTARFHLARAYFLLSDFSGARVEFELLLSLNPTAQIRQSTVQFLDAIAQRKARRKTIYSGHIAVGLGSDSNVTGGTSTSSGYFTDLNLGYEPAADEVEDADSYQSLSAGISLLHKPSTDNSIYATTELDHRANQQRDDLDYTLASLKTGYQHAYDSQSLRFGLVAGVMHLDNKAYQDSRSLELEWRNTFNARTQLGLIARQSQYRYRGVSQSASDYDDSSLSLNLLRVLGNRAEKTIGASIGLGQEKEVNSRTDGDQDYLFLSLSAQMRFNDDISGFLVLATREKDYTRENALFSVKRSESQTRLISGLIWKLGKSVSLRGIAVLSDTDSNIALYDSSREDFSVSLRKDF